MILYRRPTQLALRAALLLALEPPGTALRMRELAASIGIPATYLAKVLQSLIHAGVLQSVRGPGGGVRLARPPAEVYLWDVLSVLEPVSEYEHCFLGLGRCNDFTPCPLHEEWGPVRDRLIVSLQSLSLAEFAQAAQRKGLLQERPGTDQPKISTQRTGV